MLSSHYGWQRQWREVWFFVMCCSLIFFFYLLPDLTVNLWFVLVVPNIRHLPNRTDWRLISFIVRTALMSNMLISSTLTFFKFDGVFFSSAYTNSCGNRSTVFMHTAVSTYVSSDDIHYSVCHWQACWKSAGQHFANMWLSYCHSCECDAVSFSSLSIVKQKRLSNSTSYVWVYLLSQVAFCFNCLCMFKHGCQALNIFLNSQL